MKKLIKQILVIALVLLCYQSHSQSLSVEQIKSGMTYKFIQNLEWPNESSINVFTIGVMTDKEAIATSFNKLSKIKIRNKSIKVKRLSNISDINGIQVLYIDAEVSKRIKLIKDELATKPILLISDEAEDKRSVMINFYNDQKTLKFEINKANIINAELKIGPSLILLGGTEIDVAKLYKATQDNLDKEKEKVKEQQVELATMRQEIEVKKAEIEEQKQSIDKQKAEIEKQKSEIAQQNKVLGELNQNVLNQQKLLNEKVAILNTQIAKIANQEAAIKQQDAEMQQRSAKLQEVTKEIELQQSKIDKQKEVLTQQSARIKIQQNLIYVFIAFLLLIIVLAVVIYKSYQNQKKFNLELSQKSEQIRLGAALLAQEKEHTTKSIEYALTIQNAVLPSPKLINDTIESFVLFKPKDIVSGDFFWYHHIPATKDSPELIFIAAMDCTGHGVPGAFMSMVGTSLLNEIVKEKKIYSPRQIMEVLDKQVRISLKQKETKNRDGMDSCFCVIERQNSESSVKLTFCGAKRPLYYTIPDSSEIFALNGNRKSIGGYESKACELEFTNQEVTLVKGSRVYLTTDGFMDQNNPERYKFGRSQFDKMIKNVSSLPLNEQKTAIEEALAKHQSTSEQRDDITLIGLQI